jgi:hypothetical protein
MPTGDGRTWTTTGVVVWAVTLAASETTPTPTPTPTPTGETGLSAVTVGVLSNVAENVLTNLLTVVVLPLAIPALTALLGGAVHLLLGDFGEWREAVRDFRRLALERDGGPAGLGQAVRYWLAFVFVLLTGRLGDVSLVERGERGERGEGP